MPRTATAVVDSRSPAFSERMLGALWRRSHVLSDGLRAQDGRRFRVLYPGRASSRAGPDFLDAVIASEDGRLVVGDVELHLTAPDWYYHGHHGDSNYNGVVLHVVLRSRGHASSRQQSGLAAPVVSIGDAVTQLEGVGAFDDVLPPHLPAVGRGRLGEVLDRAGDERFLAKSQGFALELGDGDPNQVLYRSFMEGLGYASNRKPFRELAYRVPISALALLRRELTATRLLAVEAMLLSAAGLLSCVEPAHETLQMRALLKCLPKARPMSVGQWRLFRMRPANHPARRIMGAAHLVDRYLETGLVVGLAKKMTSGGVRSLLAELTVPPFIGRGRAADLMVNVLLPFLHAYAVKQRSAELGRVYLEAYQAAPRLEENEITREMRRLLRTAEQEVSVHNARRQQGLIHFYKGMVRGAPSASSV